METYISGINRIMAEELAKIDDVVLFGENIDTGSRISGMTRNLSVSGNGCILNVGNCEATQVGVGMGLMINGVSSVMFSKQLDFLLLGCDQIVNTYNIVRLYEDFDSLGSFSVVTIICDQGYQGPQSSFNCLGDLSSMAQIPAYVITNADDARIVFRHHFRTAGFRMICLSQRMWGKELKSPGIVAAEEDASIIQYSIGDGVTIIVFNGAFEYGSELRDRLEVLGVSSELFGVNYSPVYNVEAIARSISKTRKVVFFDDSKSSNLALYRLREMLPEAENADIVVRRELTPATCVSPDILHVNFESVISELGIK